MDCHPAHKSDKKHDRQPLDGHHGAMLLAGITDEKASATRALGTYALAAGGAYMPFLLSALEAIKRSTGYFHEDVREQAYLALPGLLHAAQASSTAPSGAC